MSSAMATACVAGSTAGLATAAAARSPQTEEEENNSMIIAADNNSVVGGYAGARTFSPVSRLNPHNVDSSHAPSDGRESCVSYGSG